LPNAKNGKEKMSEPCFRTPVLVESFAGGAVPGKG